MLKSNKIVYQLVLTTMAAVLFAIPFFNYKLYPFALLGLVISLILFSRSKNISSALLLGLVFGFSFFILQTSWMLSLRPYGGAWVAVGWIALSLLESFSFVLFAGATQVIHRNVKNWILASFLIAIVFAAVEILRSMGWWAYPWGLLATVFAGVKPIANIAAFTGWPGVSLIVVFISSLIAMTIIRRPSWPKILVGFSISVFLLLIIWGQSPSMWKGDSPQFASSQSTKVSLLQTNIDMRQKWLESHNSQRTIEIKKLLNKVSKNTQIIIEPETAMPNVFPNNKELLRKQQIPPGAKLLIGTLREDKGKVYNSILLGNKYYDKNNLVFMGEYVPFKFLLNIIQPLRGSLTAGKNSQLLDNIAVLICSESADWLYAREVVAKGADFIAVSTNDAWFRGSFLPAEHLQNARLRAIETGRYVTIAANYGYSAVIDPSGNVVEKSNIGRSQIIESNIDLRSKSTFFLKYGYIVTIILLIAALAVPIALKMLEEVN